MNTTQKPRGFSAIDPDYQRQIARAGGQAAHRKGTAHQWDSAAAAEAGRKGGEARARNRAAKAQQEADGLAAPQVDDQLTLPGVPA